MTRSFAAACVALVIAAAAAHAQGPVVLEVRGGAAFPTADFGDATLNTGGGAGLTVGYGFMPHTMAYVGWDLFRMTTDRRFQGGQYDVENTGYTLGLQFQHPVTPRFGYWLRAGGMYAHIELENDGDVVADSGHEPGWEVGGGLSVAVGDRFVLTPGLRYRSLAADVPVGSSAVPVDLNYLAAELGIQLRFGPQKFAAALRR